MKAVFLACSPARSASHDTWGMHALLDLSFHQLSWHTFALLLVSSCRRISDQTLTGADEPFCVIADDMVTFQFRFSLKQARPGHNSPVISLFRALDEQLCLARH